MSETEDTEWRSTMYAATPESKPAAPGLGFRPDQHVLGPSLRYVQSIERLAIDLGKRLVEAEAKIAKLEMASRTTRDAVRKNAAVLTDIEGQVAGKLDAP